MPLAVSEVSTHADFADLIRIQDLGFSTPYDGFWDVLRGPTLDGCLERTWAHYRKSPSSRWIKVTDTVTGETVAGAEFVVNKTDPYAGKPAEKIEADWWPEGPQREIGTRMVSTFYASRPARQSRPHLLVSLVFVAPEHRRRGAGALMMDWGLALARENDLEAFVEATEMARPLYEKFGFEVIGKVDIAAGVPRVEDASEEWKEVYDRLFFNPLVPIVMWRPKPDDLEVDKTK